jgi:hypothetical protein
MNIKWSVLLPRLILWALSEISLNFVGLDDIADYSEYIFDREQIVLTANHIECFNIEPYQV